MDTRNTGSVVVVDGTVVQGDAKDLAALETNVVDVETFETTRRRFLSKAAQLVTAAIAVGVLGKATTRSSAAQPAPGCSECGHCLVYRQVSPGCYSRTAYSCYDPNTAFCYNQCSYSCCICESRVLPEEWVVVRQQ